jgi:hypothetical protein
MYTYICMYKDVKSVWVDLQNSKRKLCTIQISEITQSS